MIAFSCVIESSFQHIGKSKIQFKPNPKATDKKVWEKAQESSDHYLPNIQEAKTRSIKKYRRRKKYIWPFPAAM
jgi:hypothetical protein